jgi:hypothetical protein
MNTDTAIKLLTLVVAFAAAYYSRRALKHKEIEAKQMRPKIVHINGFGKYVSDAGEE